jgi:hypothetical protein
MQGDDGRENFLGRFKGAPVATTIVPLWQVPRLRPVMALSSRPGRPALEVYSASALLKNSC